MKMAEMGWKCLGKKQRGTKPYTAYMSPRNGNGPERGGKEGGQKKGGGGVFKV